MKDGPSIGVDVGVGAMATCSDGTTVDNPKALSSVLSRLRRIDKAIARSRNVRGRSEHTNRRERLSMPDGAGSTPEWSTLGTTTITKPRRR